MKTTLKQITAGTFIALLLLVGNVKAEGIEIKTIKSDAIETSLQLENWMTNEIIWNNNTIKIMDFVQEMETGLELENWMTSDETWNLKDMNVEPELIVEPWMTDRNMWE